MLEGRDHDTKAGNYFVSNYPPFAYWTEAGLGEARDALDVPPPADRPLGLYVHIPFCRKRCHFCYFKVYTDRNAAAIKQYIDAVQRELAMYAEHDFLGGRKPQFVYFGGGTPSYLSAAQLTELTDGLKAVLPWDEVEEVTFECEPGTLNEKKLQAIRDFGVTRLSFGIENFNDHILETNGRAHLSKQVYAAYEWARAVGFPQINIDLIAGMLEETEPNWIDNIRKTIELDPDMVTIYQMEVPFNTTIFKRMKEEGKLTAPVADWDTKRAWVKYAFDELEKVGYGISSAYTAAKNPDQTRFVYRDHLWHGADLLALGVSSFGHINRTHYQNDKHIESYVKTVLDDGRLPLQRGYRINDDEALIREMILQMKTGKLERDYFRDKFDVDIVEHFADVYRQYEQAGFLTIDDKRITLQRDAMLQVDTMLHEFFLPDHRGQRYV
ncbi:coproporphyrinogen III oxidase family protein [Planctomycetales bacterium ZRK34]|nr:coproporphyrinogen III oxidase family protein [Planctomycetales bacterium ZRK34]